MLGQVREKGLRDNARKSLTSLYHTLRKGDYENDGFRVPGVSEPNQILQSVMDKEVLIADLQMELEFIKKERAKENHQFLSALEVEYERNKELELQVKALHDRQGAGGGGGSDLVRHGGLANQQVSSGLDDIAGATVSKDRDVIVVPLGRGSASLADDAIARNRGSMRPGSAPPRRSHAAGADGLVPLHASNGGGDGPKGTTIGASQRKFRRPASAGGGRRTRFLAADTEGLKSSHPTPGSMRSRPHSALAATRRSGGSKRGISDRTEPSGWGSTSVSAEPTPSLAPALTPADISMSSLSLSASNQPTTASAATPVHTIAEIASRDDRDDDRKPSAQRTKWLDFVASMTAARAKDRAAADRAAANAQFQVNAFKRGQRRDQVADAVRALWSGSGTTAEFVDTVDSLSSDFRHDYLTEVGLQVSQLGDLVGVLNSIHAMVTTSLDLGDLCSLIVSETAHVLKASVCRLYLVDDRLGAMRLWTPNNDAPRVSTSQGIAGHVARTGKAISIPFPAVQCPHFSLQLDRLPHERSNAVIAAPIIYDGAVLAVIQLFNKKGSSAETSFSCLEANMLSIVCSQAGILLRRCLFVEQTLNIADRTLTLMTLTQQYPAQPDDTFDLMYGCFQHAQAVLHARHIRLLMADTDIEDQPYLWFKVPGDASAGRLRIEFGHGVAGRVASDGLLVNVNGVTEAEVDAHEGRTTQTKSLLCAAIVKSAGRLIGVVQVLDKIGTKSFTKVDETFLALYCRQVAIGVEQGVVESAVVRSKFVPSETLPQALDRARLLLHADRELLFLADRKTGEVVCKCDLGVVRLPIQSGGLIGYTARSGLTINVGDVSMDPRWDGEMDEALGYHTNCILATAILDKSDTVIGVLCFTNKTVGGNLQSFSDLDIAMATVLAKQIASILAVQRSAAVAAAGGNDGTGDGKHVKTKRGSSLVTGTPNSMTPRSDSDPISPQPVVASAPK